MAHEIREIEENTYLVDTIRESILKDSMDRTEERLRSYPVILKECGYSVNKETLIGVATKGVQYFEDIEARKIEDYAKGSPLARTSIERMKAERIAEVIPADLGARLSEVYTDIADIWHDSGLGGLSEEDFIYKEKEISLDRRNISRKKLDLYTLKLSDPAISMIDRTQKIVEEIFALENEGLRLLNTNFGVYGMLHILGYDANITKATDSRQIDKGQLANLVISHKDGMTRAERLAYNPNSQYLDFTKAETQTIPVIPSVYGSYEQDKD